MEEYDIPPVLPEKEFLFCRSLDIDRWYSERAFKHEMVPFFKNESFKKHRDLVANINVFPFTDKEFTAVVLRFHARLLRHRVAEVMGIADGTVKIFLSRALKKIKKGISMACGTLQSSRPSLGRNGLPLGVSLLKEEKRFGDKKYKSRVWVKDKDIHLGFFATLEEAATAIRNFREKLDLKKKEILLCGVGNLTLTPYDQEYGYLRAAPFNLDKAKLTQPELLAVTFFFYARIDFTRAKKLMGIYAPTVVDIDQIIRSGLDKVCRFLVFREDDFEFYRRHSAPLVGDRGQAPP